LKFYQNLKHHFLADYISPVNSYYSAWLFEILLLLQHRIVFSVVNVKLILTDRWGYRTSSELFIQK